MKYNFKSKQEANEFLDQIADPDKIRLFAKQRLGVELPKMQEELDSVNGKQYSKKEMISKRRGV